MGFHVNYTDSTFTRGTESWKIKQIKNRFAGIVGVLTFRRIVGN